MSFAVFDVIYGVPLSDKARRLMDDWDMADDERYQDCVDEETNYGGYCGFVAGYSANAEETYFCGVRLFDFDECNVVKVTDDMIKPTKKHLASFEKKWAEVPQELKDLCDKPGIYFIPRSS